MRNVLLLASIVFATGCPCGAYEGGGNRAFERSSSEMLILCENGGFVANLASNQLEGRFVENGPGTGMATNGEDGQLAFDFVTNTDGTASTPQLGDAPWTAMDLDMVAADHANVMCNDLQTRAWWTAQ